MERERDKPAAAATYSPSLHPPIIPVKTDAPSPNPATTETRYVLHVLAPKGEVRASVHALHPIHNL